MRFFASFTLAFRAFELLFKSMFALPGYRYTEFLGYDFESGTCDLSLLVDGQPSCGHYTQLVWAETRYVGCGVALCPSLENVDESGYEGSLLVACNYYKAGNWVVNSSRTADPYTSGGACRYN